MLIFFALPFFVFAKTYPNGALIRVKGDTKVYLITGNKKEWIKTPEIFRAKKLNWRKVKIISLKEFDAIEEALGLPVPNSTAEAKVLSSTPLTSPSASVSVSPSSSSAVPAAINAKLPPPDFIKADWLISQATANYGKVGQKIVFKYSDKENDRIENYRLYEKKPSGATFVKVAEFKQILSTGCEGLHVAGEWMMTEAGQCGYWAMQRTVPPGGREMIAYLPAADYSEGEYVYYVVGVDKDGLETAPSGEAKLVFLTAAVIFSPADNQESAEPFPVFRWSIAGGWPAGEMADYLLQISNNQNALNPFWAKTFKVPAGRTEQSYIYDGSGLNPSSKYKIFVYGHYRRSEQYPDYISVPLTIPEFWIKTTGQRVSLWNFLKALLLHPFEFAF